MTAGLLAGIRVVEATEVWAGPMAASFLGDLGADVVKVESYPRASMTRPPVENMNVGPGDGPPWERSAVHHLANRNKRNMALNVRTEEGAAVLRRLLATADVMLEGYSAGTFERLGFGWDVLQELNPKLSLISMPGWGNQGPYRGYVTLGSGLDAAAGHTLLRGNPARPLEDTVTMYHSDATGAVTLVFAVLTALRRREQTGEGQYIDFSQQEGLNWHLAGQLAEWTFNHRQPERVGNREPHIVPHACFRAGGGEAGDDSWVVLAAEDDAQWGGLASAAGHPEWAEDGHPWATVTGRLAHRGAIEAALAEFALSGTAEAIADAVAAAGAIGSPVAAPWSVIASPQHQARDWLQYVVHQAAGAHVRPGFPWRIAPDPCTWDRQCGLLGEHNREILLELGYSDAEVDTLEAAAVLGNRYPAPGS